MPDPDDTIDPNDPASQPEPAAPAAPPPAPALTMEMVKELVAAEARKAYDAGAAAARKAERDKAARAPSAPKTEPTTPAITGDDAEWSERLADALTEFNFDKDQRRAIRDAARSKRPDDVDGFVAQWARMFGKQPGAATPTVQTPSTEPASPAPKAAPTVPSAPPPAAPALEGGRPPVLRELSEESRRDAWHAYVRSKGGNPLDLRNPKTRAAMRDLRTAFEGEVATATVLLRGSR